MGRISFGGAGGVSSARAGARAASALKFANEFEKRYVKQDEYEDRDIIKSLTLGWDLLTILPQTELKRVKTEYIEKYMKDTKMVENEKAEYSS